MRCDHGALYELFVVTIQNNRAHTNRNQTFNWSISHTPKRRKCETSVCTYACPYKYLLSRTPTSTRVYTVVQKNFTREGAKMFGDSIFTPKHSTCVWVLGSSPRWVGHFDLTLFAKIKIKRIQLLRAPCSVGRHTIRCESTREENAEIFSR